MTTLTLPFGDVKADAYEHPTFHIRRGDLADYSGPSQREGWAPDYRVVNTNPGLEIGKRTNASLASMAVGGLVAALCMFYPEKVSDVVNTIGSPGAVMASMVPSYILTRLAE